jgi:hypothetical protein
MAKRGPKSAEDLSEVAWIPGERADPPPDLSLEQQEVWESIAAGMPADWSRDVGTRIVLKELCRASVHARHLSGDAEAARTTLVAAPDNNRLRKEWLTLLRAFNLQAQRIADLSTKLRLTRQSRQGARRGDQIARQGSGGRRPWTDWGLGNDDDAKQ